MKKFFPLFTLVAVAIATLSSCKDDFPKTPTAEPYLNLIIQETTVAVGGEGAIEVTLDRQATDYVDVTLTSDNPALSISLGTLSIDPDARKAETTFSTTAVGKATVEIASDFLGVRYTTKKVVVDIVKPQLSLNGAKTCVTGISEKFSITSDINVIEDVVITLTSSDPTKLTVPTTLTLEKGTKKIEGNMTGVAVGDVTISFTITDTNVEIGKSVADNIPLNTLIVTVKQAVVLPNITFTGPVDAEVGQAYVFEIASDIEVTEDVTFTITSSNEKAVTVPKTVVMEKGTKLVVGDYTAVAEGETTITIATEDATVLIDDEKNSFKATVAAASAE